MTRSHPTQRAASASARGNVVDAVSASEQRHLLGHERVAVAAPGSTSPTISVPPSTGMAK